MDLFDAIEKRQSERKYNSDKKVPKESLEKIIAAGVQAPVARYEFEKLQLTVVEDEKLIQVLNNETAKMNQRDHANPFYHAPNLIIISQLKEGPDQDSLRFANAGTIGQTMALAAEGLGIATVYVASVLPIFDNNKSLLEKFAIKDGNVPTAILALGYSKDNSSKKRERKIYTNWV
jgi:nitroreductase